MAHPRIRDFLSFVTSLPAATMMAVCLFLPQTESCRGHHTQTAFESGTWAAIAPIILIGLLPLIWRLTPPHQRRTFPELFLAFTLLVMATVVILIPVAIWLMWGYAKRSYRGELLTAMCSAALVMIWLFGFPLLLVFDTWLPAAKLTWGAGFLELVGMLLWISAAADRPDETTVETADRANARPRRSPLHVVLSI